MRVIGHGGWGGRRTTEEIINDGVGGKSMSLCELLLATDLRRRRSFTRV